MFVCGVEKEEKNSMWNLVSLNVDISDVFRLNFMIKGQSGHSRLCFTKLERKLL